MIENSMTEEQINAIGYEYALHPENFEKESEMEIKCEQVAILQGGKWDKMHDISKRVYGTDGLAPTMHTCGVGNLEPKIAEPLALDEQNKYIRQDGTCGTLTTDGSSPKHNNRVVEPIIYDDYNGRVKADQSAIGTLTTNCGNDAPRNGVKIIENQYRIRKLTPRECGRLMGVKDNDIDKIAKNQSNSSQYHLYGDAIVVQTMMAIFAPMLQLEHEKEIRECIKQICKNKE